MVNHCETCRHWTRPWWTSNEWDLGDDTGLCKAVELGKNFISDEEAKRLAWPIQLSEGITASLITRGGYGCVLWEEKS